MAYKMTFTTEGEVSSDYLVTVTEEAAEREKAKALEVMAPMLALTDLLGLSYSFDVVETDEEPGVYFDGKLVSEVKES